MKNALFLFLFFCTSVFSQELPLNRPIVIKLAADHQLHLQRKFYNATFAATPNEASGEWVLETFADSKTVHIKTVEGFYLFYRVDSITQAAVFGLTRSEPKSDNFGFNLSRSTNGWQISPKLYPSLFLQPSISNEAVMKEKAEFATAAFVFDTVAVRRPVPMYAHPKKSMCDAGILIDEKVSAVSYADAFWNDSRDMNQFSIRVFTDSLKSDYFQIVLFNYLPRNFGNNHLIDIAAFTKQNSVRVVWFDNNNVQHYINQGTMQFKVLDEARNYFQVQVIGAVAVGADGKHTSPVYDLVVGGNFRKK